VGNLPNIAHVMAGHSYWTNTPVLKPGDSKYETIGLYGYRKRIADAFKAVGKEFWMTELCIMGNDEEINGGGGFDFSMEVALYVARVMHYDLTVANARSWQWWRAAGGNYKDGLIRMYVKGERTGGRGQRRGAVQENMARDSKLMWTMGNFSRFVRPGAVRLDVEGITEIDGLMLSAYRNTDGTTAIVAINYGKTDRPVSISMKGSKRAAAYRTSDTEGENLKHIGTVNLKKNILPGRSVTTFVVGK
jgi:O-glycosyl hydrolase